MAKKSKKNVLDLIERIDAEQQRIGLFYKDKTQWFYNLSPELSSEISEMGWPPEIVCQGKKGIECWARALNQI